MSRKIYPLVTAYIAQKKPMDKNFVDSYIKIYDENFPDWINELQNIMTYRYIISENPDDFKAIRKQFWYCSNGTESTDFSENGIETMLHTPVTKFVIVSRNQAEKVKLLQKKFAELKNWKYHANTDFSYKVLLADKTQLIILNQKKLSINQLIEKIK